MSSEHHGTSTITRRDALRALGLTAAAVGLGAGAAGRRRADRRGQDRPGRRAEHLRPAPDRRPQHPDLHRQRLRRADRPRRPGQPGAGPGRVLEAAEPDHLAVRPAQGGQVPQRRRLQRRFGQVHPRPGDQPGDQGHHQLRAEHDRRHRDRGPLHGERGHQGPRFPAARPPGRAVRPDALAQAHQRHGQGGHRHQAQRHRPVQAGHLGEERAAGARGQRRLLARRAEGEDDHRPADPRGRRPDRRPPDRRGGSDLARSPTCGSRS